MRHWNASTDATPACRRWSTTSRPCTAAVMTATKEARCSGVRSSRTTCVNAVRSVSRRTSQPVSGCTSASNARAADISASDGTPGGAPPPPPPPPPAAVLRPLAMPPAAEPPAPNPGARNDAMRVGRVAVASTVVGGAGGAAAAGAVLDGRRLKADGGRPLRCDCAPSAVTSTPPAAALRRPDDADAVVAAKKWPPLPPPATARSASSVPRVHSTCVTTPATCANASAIHAVRRSASSCSTRTRGSSLVSSASLDSTPLAAARVPSPSGAAAAAAAAAAALEAARRDTSAATSSPSSTSRMAASSDARPVLTAARRVVRMASSTLRSQSSGLPRAFKLPRCSGTHSPSGDTMAVMGRTVRAADAKSPPTPSCMAAAAAAVPVGPPPVPAPPAPPPGSSNDSLYRASNILGRCGCTVRGSAVACDRMSSSSSLDRK